MFFGKKIALNPTNIRRYTNFWIKFKINLKKIAIFILILKWYDG